MQFRGPSRLKFTVQRILSSATKLTVQQGQRRERIAHAQVLNKRVLDPVVLDMRAQSLLHPSN